MTRWSVLVWLAFAPAAWAGSFYLEAPAVADKADATQVAEVAKSEGQAARVVRRFRKGAGWEYVVVVDGFADSGGASAVASRLATKTGRPITVFEALGDEARAITVEAPPAAADGQSAEADGSALLGPAVKAHGGPAGGIALIEAATMLKFEFRRAVPGGPTVRHVYAERGDDRFLEVVVEEGEGASSRAGVAGGVGWLAAGEAAASRQDPGEAAGELDRFGPGAVLAFPLRFAQAAAERKEFGALEPSGTETIGGELCDVLKFEGGRGSAPLTLVIGRQDHRVRRVVFGGEAGEVTHEYTGWDEVQPGLVLPRRIRTSRAGVLIDDVEVLGIDLHPKLPDDWFLAPAG